MELVKARPNSKLDDNTKEESEDEVNHGSDRDYVTGAVPAHERGRRREVVRNDQSDPVAGVFYTVGCSLLHLAFLVAILFVKRPDVDKAREFDDVYFKQLIAAKPVSLSAFDITRDKVDFCESQAKELTMALNVMIGVHALCFAACFFREVFDANIQFLGQIMKLAELMGALLYYAVLIEALNR